MIESKQDFTLLGGDPFAAEPRGIKSGKQVALLGSTNLPRGTIVMAGVDDTDPGLDAGKVSGPRSPMTTCQPLAAASKAAYGKYGCFGVTQEDTHLAGEEGAVELGEVIVHARVQVPSGGFGALVALMPSFTAGATLGTLIPATGDTKTIALVAAKVNAPGSATEMLIPVRLRGSHGWG